MNQTDDKRGSQRIKIEVPVYIGRQKAITRDISWSGIYFLTDQSNFGGGVLDFSLNFTYALPGKPIRLDCQGEIIRVEQQGEKFGVAAKINNFQYLQTS